MHLAIALTVDLGVDRKPQVCGVFKSQNGLGPIPTSKQPTLAEHRALLGLFYLTSMLASSFSKMDAMPFTQYMEECLNQLEHAKECDTDSYLVQIIRLQHTAQLVHDTHCAKVPSKLYSQAFQSDIEKLRKTDPCTEDNIFLKLQYLLTEISTWELSLIEMQEDKSKPLSGVLDGLHRCVALIRQFFDVFFEIPSSAYLVLPLSVFGQFAHALICLTKLVSLDVDGWDMEALNDQLNFMGIVDEAAKRLEAGSGATIDGLEVKNEFPGRWAPRVLFLKQVYQNRPGQDRTYQRAQHINNNNDRSRPAEDVGFGQPTPPDDILPADFFDDNFWNSFGDFELNWPEQVA